MKKRRSMRIMRGTQLDIVQSLTLVLLFVLLQRLTPHVREQSLDDPVVSKPHLDDIVPGYLLLLLSFLVPALVFFSLEIKNGLNAVANMSSVFILGLVESNGILTNVLLKIMVLFASTSYCLLSNYGSTIILTDVLKIYVGRPRPYFAAACVSYVAGSLSKCTGDPATVTEARKSFPSGHSSLAFSCAIYLMCYLSSIVGLGAASTAQTRNSPKAWKLIVVLFFPVLACLVAASRTVDYHHNYTDVLAGSLLGASIAAVVARNRLHDIDCMRQEMKDIMESEVNANSYDSTNLLPA